MPRMCFVVAAIFSVVSTAGAAEPSKETRAAMLNLNGSFLSAHKSARKVDLENGGPVVLLRSGQLVLIRQGKETSAKVIPQRYHTLKTFAHIGPAIYLMLAGKDTLDDESLERLRRYHGKLVHLRKTIDGIGLKGVELERQKTILTASIRFLDRVIAAKRVAKDELHRYSRALMPAIQANLAGAAKAQIDGMHRQMLLWKKELSANDWNRIRIAIRGGALARNDNLAKQYFQALFGLKGESTRLVYMELYFPPTPMETLLATRSVDRRLAVAFFADPNRMFRDALADAATAYLKTIRFE